MTNNEDQSNKHDPTPVHIAPPQDGRLLEVLTSLENLIMKQTSLKFAFLRGVVYGLGTVIGATVLLALFGGLIATVVSTIGDIPLLGDFVSEEAVGEYSGDSQ